MFCIFNTSGLHWRGWFGRKRDPGHSCQNGWHAENQQVYQVGSLIMDDIIKQAPKECLCGLLVLCIQRVWTRRRRGDLFQTTRQLSDGSNQISSGKEKEKNLT